MRAKALLGLRVVSGPKGKAIGKAGYLVFHPEKRLCVGFLAKRPDVALMFHRDDLFVALDGFLIKDGKVVLRDGSDYSGSGACKRLGVNLDQCVIWQGLAIVTRDGARLGVVDDVQVSVPSGKVRRIGCSRGTTAQALLGKIWVPRKMIKGFRMGMGDVLSADAALDGAEGNLRGAILVSDEAASLWGEGGLADAAGRSVARVADDAKRASATVAGKAKASFDVARPKVEAAERAISATTDKGSFAVGRQIGKAKGMFSSFKSEYEKAVSDESKQ